jgi:hypothetical protein
VPLIVDGAAVGYLHVAGDEDPKGASATIASFLDFIEPLEMQIQELLAVKPAPLESAEVSAEETVAVEPSTSGSGVHAVATNGAAANGAAMNGVASNGAEHVAVEENGASMHHAAYSQPAATTG